MFYSFSLKLSATVIVKTTSFTELLNSDMTEHSSSSLFWNLSSIIKVSFAKRYYFAFWRERNSDDDVYSTILPQIYTRIFYGRVSTDLVQFILWTGFNHAWLNKHFNF